MSNHNQLTATNSGYASDAALAKFYDVHRGTIWRWAKEGKLPRPVKITEGCTRWRWEDILKHEGAV
jgi:predicted DNA-binding transcriptional regulator AlpA